MLVKRRQYFSLFRIFTIFSVVSAICILVLASIGVSMIFSRDITRETKRNSANVAQMLFAQEKNVFIHSRPGKKSYVFIPRKDFAVFDKRMREYLHPLQIVKIKIYSDDGTIVYSTDRAIIGKRDSANILLESALDGNIASKIKRKEEIADVTGEKKFEVDIAEIYIPLQDEKNGIIGSFEIYIDITKRKEETRNAMFSGVALLSLVLFFVFGPLIVLMKRATMRAEKLIKKEKDLAVEAAALKVEKEKSEELKSSKEFSENILNSMSDGLDIVGPDYTIRYLNKTFANVFGREALGKKCYEVYTMEKKQCDLCPLKDEIKLGETKTIEVPGIVGDKTFLITHTGMKNPDGSMSILEVFRDVTGQKKVENAQRLAQLGEMLADMAHEVNNPLQIISGNAQLLMMGATTEKESKTLVGTIYDQTQRAKDIIQRLLKFSKPSKSPLTESDMNRNIDIVVAILEHQYALEDIRLIKRLEENLPRVFVDEKAIQEVLMTLLTNAAQAISGAGDIELKSSLEGDFVRIDVKDTGCGIAKEHLDKVFTPFFTTKQEGTGLGLSVCRNIVEEFKGKLKAESTPGKGATFTVLLPCSKGKKA